MDQARFPAVDQGPDRASPLAVNLFTTWAAAMWVTDEVLVVSRVFVYPAVFTAVISAIAGSLLFTAEAQHGTLRDALTAQPARWVIAASKATIAAAVGLVLGAVGMTAGVVGGGGRRPPGRRHVHRASDRALRHCCSRHWPR